MATVKGKWTFNDVLIDTNNIYQNVNFSTDGKNWDGGNSWNSLFIGDTGAAPFRVVAFGWWSGEYGNEQAVYNLEEYDDGIIQIGWEDEAYKTVDFGATEQEVSEEFYAWLIENAVQVVENIKINITENGTTTLATAGKYCDRNIDVNVATKDADGILDGSFTGEYISDKATIVKPYIFDGCVSLSSVSLPNCTTIGTSSFRGCTALESVNLPNCVSFVGTAGEHGAFFRDATKLKSINIPKLTAIENATRAFNWCASLEEFDAPNLTSVTSTSTMFSYCTSIRRINLPKLGGVTINSNTFPNCYNLEVLILGGNELNLLDSVNAFTNTGILTENGLRIYVPDNLVDTYKTATNWAAFADKIKPISELEE